jgi:excisionase family DNA binding protein
MTTHAYINVDCGLSANPERTAPRKAAAVEAFLFTIPETCQALGIGRSKVYGLINDGRLERVKIGKRTLVRVASIRALAGEGSPHAD